jgi:hypothetical protein
MVRASFGRMSRGVKKGLGVQQVKIFMAPFVTTIHWCYLLVTVFYSYINIFPPFSRSYFGDKTKAYAQGAARIHAYLVNGENKHRKGQ